MYSNSHLNDIAGAIRPRNQITTYISKGSCTSVTGAMNTSNLNISWRFTEEKFMGREVPQSCVATVQKNSPLKG